MSRSKSNILEKFYIHLDMFGGDESEVKMEKVRMVTVRKDQECYGSWFPEAGKHHFVKKGERARLDTALVEGKWCSYYFCVDCLNKLVKEHEYQLHWPEFKKEKRHLRKLLKETKGKI